MWRYRWHENSRQLRATFGSKAEPLSRTQAERAIRNRNREPIAPTVASSRSFGEVLTEWLEYGRSTHGKRWAPQTEHTDQGMVRVRIDPVLGHIRLADLTAAHLERAYTTWSDEGL